MHSLPPFYSCITAWNAISTQIWKLLEPHNSSQHESSIWFCQCDATKITSIKTFRSPLFCCYLIAQELSVSRVIMIESDRCGGKKWRNQQLSSHVTVQLVKKVQTAALLIWNCLMMSRLPASLNMRGLQFSYKESFYKKWSSFLSFCPRWTYCDEHWIFKWYRTFSISIDQSALHSLVKFTHWWQRLPWKVPTSSSVAIRQYFDMKPGELGTRTSDPSITGGPTLPL